MDINALLSTIILVAFVVTVVLAIGSYAAYKLRERRRPAPRSAADAGGPVYFERFYPPHWPAAHGGIDAVEEEASRPPDHDALADRGAERSDGARS